DDFVAGRVVLGRGQPQCGAVVEGQNALHRTFAEGFFAENDGAFEVLQATGDDFRSAGAAEIHKHDHGKIVQFISARPHGAADVTDFVFAEREFLFAMDVFDHIHVDDGAGESVFFELAGGGAKQSHGYVSVWFAPQSFYCILKAHFFGASAIDFENTVAGKNT